MRAEPVATRTTSACARLARAALAAPLLALAAGCSITPGGDVETTGDGDRAVRLASHFENGTFSVESAQTTVVFSDIPYDDLARGTAKNGQFLHIEVLWRPKPGRTPTEPTSTNLSIRLVVVSNGEVGVYGGGGFAWVTKGHDYDDELALDITGSNLALLDKTPGFVDLLSPATMLGELGAMKNAENARATRRAASQFVTNRLGKVRWVMDDAQPARGDAAASASATEGSSGSRPGSFGM
jgi:hypothetical protein